MKAEYVCGDHSQLLQDVSIGLGKGISGWAAAYKRTMLNTGPALEFQGIEGDFSSLRDALVVPMIQEGECCGTISLYADTPALYSPVHVSLLETAAAQVAPLVRTAVASRRPSNDQFLDPVTGTHRFSYLTAAGSQVLAHAAKSSSPLSLVYLEVKNFSHSVALYGACTGDAILHRVAQVLRSEIRQTDILVRFGHQGFLTLLPGVRGPQAIRYVQRLQQQIQGTPLSLAPNHSMYVNCLAGISSFPEDGTTLLALLQAAQGALGEYARLANPHTLVSEGNILEFPPRI